MRMKTLAASIFILILVVDCSIANIGAVVAIGEPESHFDPAPSTQDKSSIESTEEASAPPAPPFIPTDEWQEVLPGQSIPPGLHVSLDFQTGKKMAKLMEEQVGKLSLQEKRERKLDAITTSIISHENGPEQAINMKADEMDNIWKPSAQMNMNIIGEELRSAFEKFKKTQDPQYLEVLEDLLHDGDVARDFSAAEGISHFAHLYDQSNSDEVRASIFRVIGTASQNNAEVASASSTIAWVPLCLQQVVNQERPVSLRRAAIYALSSIVNAAHDSATPFLYNVDGIEAMSELLEEETLNNSFKSKIIVLFTDMLVLEANRIKDEALGNSSEPEPYRAEMLLSLKSFVEHTAVMSHLGHNLCGRLSSLILSKPRLDLLDKSIELMTLTQRFCENFRSEIFTTLAENRRSWQDDLDDEFFHKLDTLVVAMISESQAHSS